MSHSSSSSIIVQDLLTKHKALCAEFLEKNYDVIFEDYTQLLHSKNYVTRRQSLKVSPSPTPPAPPNLSHSHGLTCVCVCVMCLVCVCHVCVV